MLGYSLQLIRNHRRNSSDRDDKFEYTNEKCKMFQSEKQPVISVDSKKKELIGNLKNSGRELCPKKDPILLNIYDFEDK